MWQFASETRQPAERVHARQEKVAGQENLNLNESPCKIHLPFNAVLQQGIERKNVRFHRDRQILA